MEKPWIDVNEREPLEEGVYWVKMHTGSIMPIIVEMESRFTIYPNNRNRWSGAFDWNYVMAWKEKD